MSDTAPTFDQLTDPLDAGEPFQHLHPLSILVKSVSLLGRNIILIGVLYFSLLDQNIFYTGLAALANFRPTDVYLITDGLPTAGTGGYRSLNPFSDCSALWGGATSISTILRG